MATIGQLAQTKDNILQAGPGLATNNQYFSTKYIVCESWTQSRSLPQQSGWNQFKCHIALSGFMLQYIEWKGWALSCYAESG
jgi:hypothetical protein